MSNKKMFYLSVLYEEYDISSYKGFEVSNGEINVLFYTGDYQVDHKNALQYLKENCKKYFQKSSVDNFFMDLNRDEDDYEFDEE